MTPLERDVRSWVIMQKQIRIPDEICMNRSGVSDFFSLQYICYVFNNLSIIAINNVERAFKMLYK